METFKNLMTTLKGNDEVINYLTFTNSIGENFEGGACLQHMAEDIENLNKN